MDNWEGEEAEIGEQEGKEKGGAGTWKERVGTLLLRTDFVSTSKHFLSLIASA